MLVEQALINSDDDDEITTPISQHNVHIYAGRVLRNASVEGIWIKGRRYIHIYINTEQGSSNTAL